MPEGMRVLGGVRVGNGVSLPPADLGSAAKSVVYFPVGMIFTMRLHVMQHTVLLSQFCLSVRPSVRCVYCDKTK